MTRCALLLALAFGLQLLFLAHLRRRLERWLSTPIHRKEVPCATT